MANSCHVLLLIDARQRSNGANKPASRFISKEKMNSRLGIMSEHPLHIGIRVEALTESGLWTTTAIRAVDSCDRDPQHPIYEMTKTCIGKEVVYIPLIIPL